MSRETVILQSVETPRSRVHLDMRFVESKNQVMFDVHSDNAVSCLNISVENAKEVARVLREVLRAVALHEKDAAKTVGNLTQVVRKGVQYFFHPDVLSNFDVNKASDMDLLRNADLTIEDGKVVKNRYGLVRG